MAKDYNDEEYLDNLLNSIVDDKESGDDIDKWFEDELKNIDDIDFDDEINALDDVVKAEDDAEDEVENETEYALEDDAEIINNNETIEENIDTIENNNIGIAEDNNEIDISEIENENEEDIDDLMKLLDEFDEDTPKTEDNNKAKEENVILDEMNPNDNANDDSSLNDNINETVETLDESEDIDDIEDIEKMLQEMSGDSDKSDSTAQKESELDNIENTKKDIEKNEEKDNTNSKEEKTKKKSFLKKIFSKKDKESDLIDLDAEEILEESGSALDDMAGFSMDDETSNLFKDLDELDSDNLVEKDSPKKEKKPKKEKEKKTPKEKKIKVKKERVKRKEEYIRISPLAIILMVSIISLLIFVIYFGADLFSYNHNINKATSYYVDKEYTNAYSVLVGMDVKSDDKDFYKQVENIMKVEKHINDFNSYFTIKKYAYALEALMNGIKSYDENIDKARELGTYDVLDDKLEEIDTLLKKYFNLSIDDARGIIQIESKSEYGKILNEKAQNINIDIQEGTE